MNGSKTARKPQIDLSPPRIDPALRETEAAEVLGLSPRTMQDWRCRGIGPKFIKSGRSVRYLLAELQAWMAANTRSSTSEDAA